MLRRGGRRGGPAWTGLRLLHHRPVPAHCRGAAWLHERDGGAAEARRRRTNRARGDLRCPPLPHPAALLVLRTLAPVWRCELSRLLPELRHQYPDLLDPAAVSGQAARQHLFEAVARLLRAHPADSVPLFLDNLQSADVSTLDLLHYLVGHSSTRQCGLWARTDRRRCL